MAESQPLSPRVSECCFLANRAADAKTAIVRSLSDIKGTLTTLAGVRSCAARHPWIVTGSAVAAGIVVGAMLTPCRPKKNRNSREAAAHLEAQAPPSGREPATPRTTKSFLFPIAGTVLTAVLPPLLQSWFAPAVAAKGQPWDDTLLFRDSAGAVAPHSGVD